jgi:CBS domain-containing protein
MSRVIDVMTTEVLTLGLDDSLSDVRKLMSEHRIRHIPIVDTDNKLLGLVSQRDVLAVEESSIINIDPKQRLDREQRVLVRDFFRSDILTITDHASLHQAALYIQKHKIGCLPVVDGETLRGVITDSDFVNVAINLMELMAAAEPAE